MFDYEGKTSGIELKVFILDKNKMLLQQYSSRGELMGVGWSEELMHNQNRKGIEPKALFQSHSIEQKRELTDDIYTLLPFGEVLRLHNSLPPRLKDVAGYMLALGHDEIDKARLRIDLTDEENSAWFDLLNDAFAVARQLYPLPKPNQN